MRRELGYFTVDGDVGFDQERFEDSWLKRGGCGTVTACDLCICLAKYHGLTGLYAKDTEEISEEEYVSFAVQMRKFLGPRPMGIWKTEMFTEGFNAYMESIGYQPLVLRDFSGKGDVEEAVELVRKQINQGYPVPYLMLRHLNVEKYKDFIWHWFLVVGYEKNEQGMWIDVATYGEKVRLDLMELWKTGCEEKGGIVIYELKNTEVQSKNE